jgi:hypothetical protein
MIYIYSSPVFHVNHCHPCNILLIEVMRDISRGRQTTPFYSLNNNKHYLQATKETSQMVYICSPELKERTLFFYM